MAKKDETQEMPVTVETVQEQPLKTTETVEIKQAKDKPDFEFVETEEAPDKTLHGRSDETFIVNEDTGTMTVIYSRRGYAKRPIPAGWREATEEELATGKKGKG